MHLEEQREKTKHKRAILIKERAAALAGCTGGEPGGVEGGRNNISPHIATRSHVENFFHFLAFSYVDLASNDTRERRGFLFSQG